MRQPYIYTLPEQFINDLTVPLHWKLYTIINGFWISGKPVFASNAFFAEKLKCSERHIRSCLEKLEEMGLLERTGKSQNRTIVPKGGTSSSYQGGTDSSVRAEPAVPHISDSSSVSNTSESEIRVVPEEKETEPRSKTKPKYPNARTAFSWFPRVELSWGLNTTELKHGELLFLRGERQVKTALRFVAEHKGEEYFPTVTKPSDLERKWKDIVAKQKTV